MATPSARAPAQTSVTHSCLVWWASLTNSERQGHKTPMAGQTRPSAPIDTQSSSAFHENRPRALRALAFAHDAKTLGYFGIGLEQATEIATETVLVELIVGLDVPKPAAVGGNFVRHDNAHHVVFPEPTRLHLEV